LTSFPAAGGEGGALEQGRPGARRWNLDSLENETREKEHTDGTAAHARSHTGGMGSLRGRGHGYRSMEISRWKRIGDTKEQIRPCAHGDGTEDVGKEGRSTELGTRSSWGNWKGDRNIGITLEKHKGRETGDDMYEHWNGVGSGRG